MSLAHVDLLAPELEAPARGARSRVALALGCVLAFALAAVPAALSLLLLTRPAFLVQ
jgi:hypothetical protein